jgi:lambda repressor-like predicted transcriptional regulator
VIFADGVYYACGTNGIDFSKDHGMTWQSLSKENGLSMCTDKRHLYISCPKGKVLKMKLIK